MKTFGMVNANPDTIRGTECITIINGFSNLMMEVRPINTRINSISIIIIITTATTMKVFGPEKGVGARSAVGLATLPHNCPVEVECVFMIKK